jgi:hypothetical protein
MGRDANDRREAVTDLDEQAIVPRVYVDELPERRGKWSGGGHMFANDLAALHAMADMIGLRRVWFQGHKTFPHYHLTASKRRLALAHGAVEIDLGEIPEDVLMKTNEPGVYQRRCDRV